MATAWAAAAWLALAAGPDAEVAVEARAVPGSAFAELHLVAEATGEVEALCARAFGTGRAAPGEPHLLSRRVLLASADERLTYEQLAPPLVAHRDFALRSRRTRPAPGTCRVDFEVDNREAPPPAPGWVRIERLSGSFAFQALGEGRVRVTHVIHLEPGGQAPAWLVEGTRREMSVARVRALLRPEARPPAGPDERPVAALAAPSPPAPATAPPAAR